jgi:hypothetical protein
MERIETVLKIPFGFNINEVKPQDVDPIGYAAA